LEKAAERRKEQRPFSEGSRREMTLRPETKRDEKQKSKRGKEGRTGKGREGGNRETYLRVDVNTIVQRQSNKRR